MKLQEKVLQETLAQAASQFTGELDISLASTVEEWDSTLLRQVLDVSMNVRYALSDFEVILDKEEKVAGFIDHAQWKKCQYVAISETELVQIGVASGWLSAAVHLQKPCHQGQKDDAVIELTYNIDKTQTRYLAGFNVGKRSMIYLVPVGINVYG